MDLAHASWLHGDDGRGEVGSDGEGCWVDDFHGSAGDVVRALVGEVVGVALGSGDDAGGCGGVLVFDVFWGAGAGEDVEVVFWDVVEGFDGDS